MVALSLPALVLISTLLFAEPISCKLITPETDTYINSLLEHWNSTGLSVAVIRKDPSTPNGWYHEFGSYGIANAKGDPVTPDTVFGIASNSKLFLAFSVGLLIDNSTLREERGKELKWTTKAKEVYGDLWEMWDENMTRGVDLQDMVSHRTGMPGHGSSLVPSKDGVREMISRFRYLRPSAELRQTYQYNNLIYNALSYLPTLLLNQTYESYIDQHMFKPLNMSSSTYSVAEAESRGTLANGFTDHMRDFTKGDKGLKRAMIPYFDRNGEERVRAGSGGVLSSARDLVMWASMLLNNGKHPYTGEQVIPSHVVDHAATSVTVAEGKPSYPELSSKLYGAGHWIYSYRGHQLIEHGGINHGFRTQVTRFPNDNLAVVVLSNDGNGGWVMDSAKWRIVDDILFKGQNPIDWSTRYEHAWANYAQNLQISATSRPSIPKSPSQPLELLARRTYHDPGYGSIQPCAVPSSLSIQTFHQREECSTLLNSLPVRRILRATNLTIPTFIVPWKKAFSTHLRIQHFDANLFNVSMIWSNAEVRQEEGLATPSASINSGTATRYGRNQAFMSEMNEGDEDEGDVLTGLDSNYPVEWVTGNGIGEEGLAFRGNFWGIDGPFSKVLDGEGKESAEVWFARSE